MKIIITENQFKKLIENILIEQQNNPDIELEKEKFYKESNMKIWFLENVVDKVKQITKPEYPNSIFYVDKNTDQQYMAYDQEGGYLWVSDDKIWSYLYSNYSEEYGKIEQLIKILMAEFYGLKNNIRVRNTKYVKTYWFP